MVSGCGGEAHAVFAVAFGQHYVHMFLLAGIDDSAHVISVDGQLAVPPVDKGQQLHATGAAIVEQGLKRGWRTFLPEFKFTTDNAAMIAMAGYYHYQHGDFSSLDVSPVARLEEL